MNISIANLPQSVLFEVSGKDAERYLNNRLTTDIKKLTDKQSVFASALSAQGKSEAFFSVTKFSSEKYLLLADGGNSAEILSALSRYKVADRVSFSDVSENYSVKHAFSDCAAIRPETFSNLFYFVSRNRFGTEGLDLVLTSDLIAEGYQEIDSERQNLLRLKARIPQFPSEIGPHYLLQESGLDGSYSTSKGCYVGQEVIQKIASFAQSPWKLIAFCVEGNPEVSVPICANPEGEDKVGTIISLAYEDGKTYGFARVKSKSEKRFIAGQEIESLAVNDFTKKD